ncbi:MAG: domain S-box protein [Capsulimonas sp.]|nr:domain S-box protein [Capsulimonas sp.]
MAEQIIPPAVMPGKAVWIFPVVLLSVAYGLLALTFTEQLSHQSIMERCVLVDPNRARIWSVGNVEIGMAYFGVFAGMLFYFLRMYQRSRQHLKDLGLAITYLGASFALDYFCVQTFRPFIALLIGDAIVMTFTVLVSRQTWFQRLLGVFVPIIFLTCGIGHFLEGLSYWQLTYTVNTPWTMVTADVGFAVLVNASRFPAFIRGEDIVADLAREKAKREMLEIEVSEWKRLIDENERIHAEAERTMKEGQQLLEGIIDNTPAVVYAKAVDGKYLLANRRFCEMFHFTKEAVIGKTDHDLFPKDAADAFRAMDVRVAERGEAITGEETAPQDDGLHHFISVKCPIRDSEGNTNIVFGISTDISERKRAEEALRESEERTRLIIETALDAVITINSGGAITGWNPQAEATFGWSREQAVGRMLTDTIIPELYREQHLAGLKRYLTTGDSKVLNRRIELTAVDRDGEEHPVEIAITPIQIGETTTFSAFVREIGERKEAERKIQSHLGRLDLLQRITRAIGERQDVQSILQVVVRSIEEDLPVDFACICTYDQAGAALHVTCVGVKSEDLASDLAMTEHATIPIDENGLSRCVRGELVYEPDVASVLFPFPQRLLHGGLRAVIIAPLIVESKVFGILVAARRRAESFSSGESEFLRQLSEHTALAAHQAQLYDTLQQAYDDLRRSQQTVLHQERLRALGQMASGIAHDINNALSPVALYTESLLETEPGLSERARDYLETIQRSIDDVAQTVARMREFYRNREPQLILAPVDLNSLIQHVIGLTRARWSDIPQQRGVVIELDLQLSSDLPPVMGVESEIREALTNLVLNCVDAMPEGGRLSLRSIAREEALGPVLRGRTGLAARYALVEVSDTGIGMDEDTRRHCLEPFFTTKGDRGTGLGLAMVYGVAQRHGAEIEIQSVLGEGTTMRLVFPAPTPGVHDPADQLVVNKALPRLRILVVDDDPLLIKSLQDILQADGHVVVTANGGQAGIEAFHSALASSEPFAAVITDLGMPHVDGRKVAAAVKEASPATPVILLTGWGQRLVDDHDVPPHVDQTVSKPPKLPQLREALSSCLIGAPKTAGKP